MKEMTTGISAAFAARAYPADDISLAKLEGARAAYEAVKGRAFPSGKGRPGVSCSPASSKSHPAKR